MSVQGPLVFGFWVWGLGLTNVCTIMKPLHPSSHNLSMFYDRSFKTHDLCMTSCCLQDTDPADENMSSIVNVPVIVIVDVFLRG